jgi:orotate phosphoribosyltransferase
MSEDLLALFRKTGALLDGHFVLRSGLHSREYFQCALLLQHTEITAKACGWLADKVRQFDCDAVISPALGGMIVGEEVGRSLGKRHIFVEKDEGKLVLRRLSVEGRDRDSASRFGLTIGDPADRIESKSSAGPVPEASFHLYQPRR